MPPINANCSAALGELELRRGKCEVAREHFGAALLLARNSMERRFLRQRVGACEEGASDPSALGSAAFSGLMPPTENVFQKRSTEGSGEWRMVANSLANLLDQPASTVAFATTKSGYHPGETR